MKGHLRVSWIVFLRLLMKWDFKAHQCSYAEIRMDSGAVVGGCVMWWFLCPTAWHGGGAAGNCSRKPEQMCSHRINQKEMAIDGEFTGTIAGVCFDTNHTNPCLFVLVSCAKCAIMYFTDYLFLPWTLLRVPCNAPSRVQWIIGNQAWKRTEKQLHSFTLSFMHHSFL